MYFGHCENHGRRGYGQARHAAHEAAAPDKAVFANFWHTGAGIGIGVGQYPMVCLMYPDEVYECHKAAADAGKAAESAKKDVANKADDAAKAVQKAAADAKK